MAPIPVDGDVRTAPPHPLRRVAAAAWRTPAVLGAVVAAISVVLPWASVVGTSGEHAGLRGLETDDGPVVLVLALVAAVVAVQPRLSGEPSSRARALVVAALGLGAALLAGLQLLDLRDVLPDLEDDPTVATAEVGSGVVLAVVAGLWIALGALAGELLSSRERARRRRRETGARSEGSAADSVGPAPR